MSETQSCEVCGKQVSDVERVDVLKADNSHAWRHPECHEGVSR